MASKTKTSRGGPRQVAQTETLSPVPDGTSTMAHALERAFAMAPEDAVAVAEIVAERFEGQREVNDESIDAEVRSLFYTLEGRRILSFRREEYETAEGQKRRAFFWRIRSEVVMELAMPPAEGLEEDVYAQLPAECWRREAEA